MKNERMGVVMIFASLAVIALIISLLFHELNKKHRAQIRIQGVSVVQALASIPAEQLASKSAPSGLLNALANFHENPDFAYATIVDPQGAKLAGAAVNGLALPPASFSDEPSSWFGEHLLVASDGREIREFYGPVLQNGNLAGHARVGYWSTGGVFGVEQLSFLASLALPIFLLTPLFYFLLKRETKPLVEINRQIEQLVVSGNAKPIEISATGDLRDFMRRFNRFMQLNDARMRELEGERINALTSNHMLGYRKEKIEAVLQALPEAVIVIDETGTTTFANAKVEPLLGARVDTMIGKQPQEWCDDADLLSFFASYRDQAVHAHRMSGFEYASEGAPEKKIAVSAHPLLSPHDAATVFGTLFVFRDNTHDFLAKRAGAEFVANVSHELKTPLNVLAMYSETLLDTAEKGEAPDIVAVNAIHDEVERMSALIGNLLSISKIEMGSVSLDRQRVKLPDLLRDAFDHVAQNGAVKDLQFDFQIPHRMSPVALDKDLFRIAINNLLTNAIKYNRPGGTVALAAEESDEHIEVRVRDSGIGIAPPDREKIFDKFYRSADQEACSRGGHGLGLFLCKEIIELHHGKLSVISETGRGSEFVVTLKKTPALLAEAI